jgi:SIR2-like domain
MRTEENWDRLKKDYRKTGIVLALGAGVSKGCALPDWRQLLKRIAQRCYGDRGPALIVDMIRDGYTLPAIATILEADCPKRSKFGEIIRDALYDKFPYYRKSTRGRHSVEFVKFVRVNNPTLSAIAALCALKQRSTFTTNPLVHGIVNFNFDSTLREYTRERYRPVFLRTVERPSAEAIPGRINVYHVHGFFQFLKGRIGKPAEEAPDIRVFTEQDYFNFFNQPNSLFSYTFLYLLRAYRMLFIGMSLKDDNIRRLLHYSKKEIYESYKKEKVSAEKAEEDSVRHYAIQKYEPSDRLKKITETSLRRLGVRVLWVKNFLEVPERLQQLYESTGFRWRDVYKPVRKAR